MDIQVVNPFPFEALPRVWRWIEQFRAKVADDFAPRNLAQFMESMASQWDGQTSWAVLADGELGGLITYLKLSPWVGTAHCLFKPEFQAKGIAFKACHQAVSEMFATGIGKLVFYPMAGNLAIGSLVCSLGAKREGTLVAQTIVDGKPADILIYGLTKENFNAINDSRSDRSRGVDLRIVPIGETQDHDQQLDHDADVHGDGRPGECGIVGALEPTLDGPGSGHAGH